MSSIGLSFKTQVLQVFWLILGTHKSFINKENNVFKDGIGVQGLRFKVVKLSSLIPWDLGHAEQLSFSCLWSKVISDVNISETVYPIYLKINMRRVASGDSLHISKSHKQFPRY